MAGTIERSRTSKWQDPQNVFSKSSLEAAAEAAAKVNATLIAQGKWTPSKISNQQSNKSKKSHLTGEGQWTGGSNPTNLMVAEVEINDVPIVCRNLLTRGSTQDEISKFSGAAVSTRGRYLTPEERIRNHGERSLYLCVQGPHQESVDLAVKRINEIINNHGYKQRNTRFSPAFAPPALPSGPRPPPLMSINAQPTGLPFVQEKLFVGLEHAPPNFDVKNKLLGPGGCYLQHIQTETAAKVTLRGKGSGFMEPTSGREAFEPMHIHLQHGSMMGLQQAKQLSENLILTVQQEYAQFQQALAAMPPTISPGTASLLAGIHQPTSIATMMPPQPGALNTFNSLGQPTVQHIQGGPGLLPNSSIATVVFTTTVPTASSMAPPTFFSQANEEGAPQLVFTSMPAPSVSTVPGSLSVPPPGHMIVGQPQSMPQMGPLVTPMAPHGGLQLVTQPTLQSVHQPPPVHTFYTQIPSNSVGQPVSVPGPPVVSSSVSSAGYTVSASGYAYGTPTASQEEPSAPQKRRFKEEKEEDKVPENLLGYQHGPPHLTNLVSSGPPVQLPTGVPHLQMEERQSPVYVEQTGHMQTPPQSSGPFSDQDKHLMPPPPLPNHGNRRGMSGEPDRKRVKGALGEVAVYGSDEEYDEEGGNRELNKLSPNGQFSPGVSQVNFQAQPLQQLHTQQFHLPQPPNLHQAPPFDQFQCGPPQQQQPPPPLFVHQPPPLQQPPPQTQLQQFSLPPPPTSQSPVQFQQFQPNQSAPFIQRTITEQQFSPGQQLQQFAHPQPPSSPHPNQFSAPSPQILGQPYPGAQLPQSSQPHPHFQHAPPGMPFWVTQN